jgi:hypothetical protein
VLSCFFSGLAKSTNLRIELFVFDSPCLPGANANTRETRLISPTAGVSGSGFGTGTSACRGFVSVLEVSVLSVSVLEVSALEVSVFADWTRGSDGGRSCVIAFPEEGGIRAAEWFHRFHECIGSAFINETGRREAA